MAIVAHNRPYVKVYGKNIIGRRRGKAERRRGRSKPLPYGLVGNGSTQPTVGVGALDDPCAGNECFAFKILRVAQNDTNKQRCGR